MRRLFQTFMAGVVWGAKGALMHRLAPDIFGWTVATVICAGLAVGLRSLAVLSLPLFIGACLTVCGLAILLALILDGRRP